MRKKIVLYWSRRDFRLHDNPALHAAIEASRKNEASFLPLFILEDYLCEGGAQFQFGYPSRYFLARALPEFAKNFPNFLILKGKAAKSIIALCEELSRDYEVEMFVNEDVYVDFYTQVTKIRAGGIAITVCEDQMTVSKETRSEAGNLYSVFTPFKKAVWKDFLSKQELPKVNLKNVISFPLSELNSARKQNIVENTHPALWKEFSTARVFTAGSTLYNIDELLSTVPNFETLENFYCTEEETRERATHFIKNNLSSYKDSRDMLSEEGTSKLSLGLAWGLISARSIKSMLQKYHEQTFEEFAFTKEIPSKYVGGTHYISELIWREFYKYLFFHNPKLFHEEFQTKFRGTIAWVEGSIAKERFTAWIQGKTGYPIVDAAMMQLAKSGWMHNRARMIVASVLTKNLGVDWRWGQEYFRAMLLDLDEASNNGGWQWGASVGADPKPIRIFNPYLQAENYDPENKYQNTWLGEENTSVTEPMVPHKEARVEALVRYGLGGNKELPVRDY